MARNLCLILLVLACIFYASNGLRISTKVLQLSQPRYRIGTAAVDDFVIFIGGQLVYDDGSSRVDIFRHHPTNDSWTTAASFDLSKPKRLLYGASTNGVAVFTGNREYEMYIFSSSNLKKGLCTPQVKAITYPRDQIAAVAVPAHNLILFAGGVDFLNNLSQVVEVYEVVNNTVVTRDSAYLSSPRTAIAATVFGSEVFFAGGYSRDSGAFDYSNVVEKLNVVTYDIVSLGLDIPRAYSSGFTFGNTIFFAGGWAGGDEHTTTHVISFSALSPTIRTNHTLSAPRSVPAIWNFGENIIIAGGGNDWDASDVIDVLNTTSKTWSNPIGSLPTPIREAGYASVSPNIFVMGGGRSARFTTLSSVYVYYNVEDLPTSTSTFQESSSDVTVTTQASSSTFTTSPPSTAETSRSFTVVSSTTTAQPSTSRTYASTTSIGSSTTSSPPVPTSSPFGIEISPDSGSVRLPLTSLNVNRDIIRFTGEWTEGNDLGFGYRISVPGIVYFDISFLSGVIGGKFYDQVVQNSMLSSDKWGTTVISRPCPLVQGLPFTVSIQYRSGNRIRTVIDHDNARTIYTLQLNNVIPLNRRVYLEFLGNSQSTSTVVITDLRFDQTGTPIESTSFPGTSSVPSTTFYPTTWASTNDVTSTTIAPSNTRVITSSASFTGNPTITTDYSTDSITTTTVAQPSTTSSGGVKFTITPKSAVAWPITDLQSGSVISFSGEWVSGSDLAFAFDFPLSLNYDGVVMFHVSLQATGFTNRLVLNSRNASQKWEQELSYYPCPIVKGQPFGVALIWNGTVVRTEIWQNDVTYVYNYNLKSPISPQCYLQLWNQPNSTATVTISDVKVGTLAGSSSYVTRTTTPGNIDLTNQQTLSLASVSTDKSDSYSLVPKTLLWACCALSAWFLI